MRGAERLFEIADQVGRLLDAGGEPQQVARTGRVGPSTLARCSIRLSTPPMEVARFQSCTFAAVAMAAASPPFTLMDSMPPKPPVICRAAISWPGKFVSPG